MQKFIQIQQLNIHAIFNSIDNQSPNSGDTINALLIDSKFNYVKIVIDKMAQKLGLNINQIQQDENNPTSESKTLYPNSNQTACVNDVKNKTYDLCVGDFWVTPERTEIASFVMPMDSEKAIFVLKSNSSYIEQAIEVLFPYSVYAWLGILLCHLILTLLQFMFEYGENNEEFNPKEDYQYSFFSHLAKSFQSAFGSSPNVKPKTLPGKFIQISMASFYMLFVCAYIGNLTALFTFSAFSTSCDYQECIVREGKSVYISNVMKSQVDEGFPALNDKELVRTINDYSVIINDNNINLPTDPQYQEMQVGFHALLTDKVDVFLLSHNEIRDIEQLLADFNSIWVKYNENIRNYMQIDLCKRLTINNDQILQQTQIGFPVIPEFHHKLNSTIIEMEQKGVIIYSKNEFLDPLQEEALDKQSQKSCINGKFEESYSLSLQHYFGVIAVIILLILTTFFIQCQKCCCSDKIQIQDEDSEHENSNAEDASNQIELEHDKNDKDQLKQIDILKDNEDDYFNFREEVEYSLTTRLSILKHRIKTTSKQQWLCDNKAHQVQAKRYQQTKLRQITKAELSRLKALEVFIENDGNHLEIEGINIEKTQDVIVNLYYLSNNALNIFLGLDLLEDEAIDKQTKFDLFNLEINF